MSWSLPIKTENMLKEANHAPSAQYAKDIHKVVSQHVERLGRPAIALEVGAAWGISTLAILEAGVSHLTSVDPNLNIKAPAEVEANGYKDKYAWWNGRSDKFWSENTSDSTQFDIIYIDGSHLYDDVKNDLYKAWGLLRSGGILLCDDWDHKNNAKVEEDHALYGVSLACWEFLRDHEVSDMGIEGRVLWFEK